MGLGEYHRKRRFTETPEPKGAVAGKAAGPLRFVVQKHAARRLHYDFRLEFGGTLKSWAVPKGPSLNPADKRLAMHVEDHPLDYRTFEGIIPEGNYGAGTVMVWDEGTFCSIESADRAQSEKALSRGYHQGHLRFVLDGKKLKGEFSLIKIKGKDENAWLLVKKSDAFARRSDVTRKDKSVSTGRKLDAIARQAPAKGQVWHSKKTAKALPLSKAGHLVKPMLATLVDRPFSRDGWIFEIKWDGYRAIADVSKKGVFLYSRNHQSFAAKYPSLMEALGKVGRDCLLDGEIVAVDAEGRPNFQLLQNAQREPDVTLVYYVFDCLRLDGKDLRERPLRERKRLLAEALPEIDGLAVSDHIETEGEDFFRVMNERGLEGMMAKDASSEYVEGRRTDAWLKIKTHLRQEAIIAGFTEPRGARKRFGSLILAMKRDGKLVYIGHTGTGFNRISLEQVWKKMQPLKRRNCPFAECPKTNTPATWLDPKLVCEVSFQEWTGDGHMRQPSFEGLREDKPAAQVHREDPKPVITPKLTHAEKIYWPKEKITKGDLVDYYRDIAPVILPYLVDRPQSMHRHPNGITQPGFFQKDTAGEVPDWVQTVRIHSESNGKEIEYLLCQNAETLLYMANLGCIEINPWNSRVGSLDNPDWVVIDLDPEKIGFDKVIEAAQHLRKLFDRLEIASYPKTSGATGMHVYVPLAARYDYDDAKRFAEIIANVIQGELPGTTSVLRSPAKRQRRVYLDFLQNRRGQTLAAPYSVRPRRGATVSTPLRWSEVRRGLDPARFTLRTIRRRLDKLGDLFEPVRATAGADLGKVLAALEDLAA